MKNVLIATMAILILLLAAFVGVLLQEPSTSAFEIDKDRAAIAVSVTQAKEEAAKYSGGFIKSFIELRLSILLVTDAMLEQKRQAIIRRITMVYPVGSKPAPTASESELNEIITEIKQAEDRLATSKKEASKYTGGLVQGLALMKAETDDIAVSQLRLKFYSAKHGFPILPVTSPSDAQKPTGPLGRIVGDKDGL
jgi:hypothetical protein